MASLRFGEVKALQRRDVELESATIQVRQQFVEVTGQGLVLGAPKSRAGTRMVAVPTGMVRLLRDHLDEYVDRDASSLVFTTSTGVPIRRGSFNKMAGWAAAVASIGQQGLHFLTCRYGQHAGGWQQGLHPGPDGSDGSRLDSTSQFEANVETVVADESEGAAAPRNGTSAVEPVSRTEGRVEQICG